MVNGITREEYNNGFLDSMYIEYRGTDPETAGQYRILDVDLTCLKIYDDYEKAEDYIYRKGFRA